ncbi:MAG: hypothetical protein FWF15_02305 [Oscillospiraceae bacterium]|nr:hypothetical protein [Oscillospiraceae bacterium]
MMRIKKRSEGFFGLHFDFHAGADCTEVGKTVTEEMIREIIETLNPDFIQCDCKGHAGYSSYPTKVGNPVPGFIGDPLKTWRKVTKEYGIPLVMHYSGVWDTKALEIHPEWAVINEDGSPNKNMTSTFKGYADGLLIPQLTELANDYGIDAVWVDGECWATAPDFDGEIIAMFEKESGMKLNRDDKRSKEYRSFLDFCRKQFFKYLAHYTDGIHTETKNFEIASNWAFSGQIPAPVCVNVDYLSGDFNPIDSYNSARFESRVLCEQNKPWDLMAWGFFYDFAGGSYVVKSAVTLCREAVSVLPLGGGFQVYNTQNRDGSVKLWEVRELKDVAKFVRDREPFLKHCKPFSNIGVLYSYYDMANKSDSLFFSGGNEDTRSAVKLILDSAHTCGILMDYMLTSEYLKDKNIIILPEIKYINDEIKSALLSFTENGGNLIISGWECCKLFEDVLDGVKISSESKNQIIYIYDAPRYISQRAKFAEAKVSHGGNTEVAAECSSNLLNAVINPVISKTKYGKGNIIAVYYNIFELYSQAPDFYVRNMISKIIDSLDTEKFIEYKGQKFVDIVTCTKDGKLMINLTNTSGIYSENRLRAYDEIQSMINMEISVKTESEPKSVMLQPENIVPAYRYDSAAKKLTVKIDRLDIHTIVVIEF